MHNFIFFLLVKVANWGLLNKYTRSFVYYCKKTAQNTYIIPPFNL